MTNHFPKRVSERKTLCLVRSGETPTLEDAITGLLNNPHLSQLRRRDLVSSLRRVAAACDAAPSQLLGDPGWLRQKLALLAPMRLGNSPKTRANIFSNAIAALACAGMSAARRPKTNRCPEWQELWQHLTPSAKIALGSFTRFCSFHQIQPAQVSDQVVADYRDVMTLSSLRKKPAEAIHDLTMHWNRAIDLVPGWPKQQLTILRRRIHISPPVEALPASFREDLHKYISRLKGGALLDPDPVPPLAAATIKHRQTQIRRFWGELVASGMKSTDIIDLRAMVQPAVAYRGLQAMLDRNGGRSSGMIDGMSYTLLIIAKHWAVLPDADLQKLRTACRRLKHKRQGMTEKNRARLRQFDDRQNLNALLLLPEQLLREAKASALPPLRAAALVEIALAIELFLMTALRVKNLALLSLDENIRWTRSSKRGVCHLVVDRRHVKNQVDREHELEGQTVELLKLFLEVYRPKLAPVECRWLFARRDGTGPVDPVVLARRVSKTIRQRTGLAVNVHLFRSLGTKLYLDKHPGAYEVARLVLGHKHLSTTTSAYTGMESIAAAKKFDQTLRDRREQARGRSNRASRKTNA